MASRLPQRISVEYYRDMLRQIRLMERLMQKAYAERIAPLIMKFEYEVQREAEKELKTNAQLLGGLSERLRQLHAYTLSQASSELSLISLEIQRLFNIEFSTGIAKKFVNKINITDKKNITQAVLQVGGRKAKTKIKAIKALQDRGIDSIVQHSMKRNVGLIQSIPQQYFQRVQEAIYDGLEKGTGTKELGKVISDIGGVTERRGKFIARDQLASVHGDLTKKRQQNLGLKKFMWLTSKDERVRDTHEALEGMIFEWDTGASGPGVPAEMVGLVPGEDFNCRCTSTVVEDDIFEALDKIAED